MVARCRRSVAEVALLKTFADQAVIAIENVRLFKELEARNRDLTATGEILRVIASSPTDVQPVFDSIVASAARLCDGTFATLATYDGELMHLVAAHNWTPAAFEAARRVSPARPTRALFSGRAILARSIVHVPDVELDSEFMESSRELRDMVGFRSSLMVPMLRDGEPVGVIGVGRAAPGFFSDSQVALLKTFADQAVIAIENVRLFEELEARNAELTTALERQTATSEILRVISRSPTDVQPVFDAIARNAVALCGGIAALVLRYDGEMLHIAGHHEMSPDAVERVERAFPRRPGRDYPPGRALLERQVVHIPDLQAATEFTASTARSQAVPKI